MARLRATAAPGSRLLFRPELGAGAHVGPAGRYDLLRYEAEILAFILDEGGSADTQVGRGLQQARGGLIATTPV